VSTSAAQLLEALLPGGIVPVQVTLTVWPMVEGTVMLLEGGVDAKLSKASKTPTEQRLKASKTRGLKRPDLEAKYFRMVGFFLWIFWQSRSFS
jgi:hypothetical protein